jgi:peptide/nickel transport system ATP-binding protein
VQFVGQDSVSALNPRETALHALRRPLTAITADDVDARAHELMRRVRLPDSAAHRRPGALSGGERQRLNLARALAAAPLVIVCDEITSSLDRRTAHAVLDLLAELSDRDGLAVLLVSHDPDAITRTAQHVVDIPHPHTFEEYRT